MDFTLERLGSGGLELAERFDYSMAKVHPLQFVAVKTGHEGDALDRLAPNRGKRLLDNFNRTAKGIFPGCDLVRFQSCFPTVRWAAALACLGFMVPADFSFF